jgi:hypothetical protein
MTLRCLVGLHDRSRSRARYSKGGYVSVCKRCQRPLRKRRDGKWVVTKLNDDEPRDSPGAN